MSTGTIQGSLLAMGGRDFILPEVTEVETVATPDARPPLPYKNAVKFGLVNSNDPVKEDLGHSIRFMTEEQFLKAKHENEVDFSAAHTYGQHLWQNE
jgi:hypothetical protein